MSAVVLEQTATADLETRIVLLDGLVPATLAEATSEAHASLEAALLCGCGPDCDWNSPSAIDRELAKR